MNDLLYASAIGSTPDPYSPLTTFQDLQTRPDLAQFARITNLSGRTQVTPLMTTASRLVIICIGQSNIGNWVGEIGEAFYVPANTQVQNFNVSDGGVYTAAEPLLGANGDFGSIPIRIGDQLRTAGVPRVILAPMAYGSTSVADWAAGGLFNRDIGVMVRRLRSVNLEPTHICWAQGERDAADGTTRGNYVTRLTSVINTFRALNVTCPFLVGKSSYQAAAVSTTIQNAYADTIAANSNTFAGADTDSLGETYRIAGVHFTKAGADIAAGRWKDVILSH